MSLLQAVLSLIYLQNSRSLFSVTTHTDCILESVFGHGSMFRLSLELARVPSQAYQCWAQHSPLLGVLGRQMGQCVRKASDEPTGIENGVIAPASYEGHNLSLAHPHVPGT